MMTGGSPMTQESSILSRNSSACVMTRPGMLQDSLNKSDRVWNHPARKQSSRFAPDNSILILAIAQAVHFLMAVLLLQLLLCTVAVLIRRDQTGKWEGGPGGTRITGFSWPSGDVAPAPASPGTPCLEYICFLKRG